MAKAKKKVIKVKAKKPLNIRQKLQLLDKKYHKKNNLKVAPAICFPTVTLDTGTLKAIRNLVREEFDKAFDAAVKANITEANIGPINDVGGAASEQPVKGAEAAFE